MKRCSNCREEKPQDEFYNSTKAKDGKQNRCKACDAARQAVRLQAGRYNLREYNVTREWVTAAILEQDGQCGICRKVRPLVIDHDHGCCPSKRSCGRCVRGLICRQCNAGIGLLGDSVHLVEAAARYLRKEVASS